MVKRFIIGEDRIAYVFVSHISDDKPRLRVLVRQLITRGINVWIDNPDLLDLSFGSPGPWFGRLGNIGLGQNWRSEIKAGLEGASAVLIAWTSNSLKAIDDQPRRQVFKAEIDHAMARKIQVPVDLDKRSAAEMVARNHATQAYWEMQGARLIDYPMDANAERAFESVLQELSRHGLYHPTTVQGTSSPASLVPPSLDDLGSAARAALREAQQGNDGGRALHELGMEFEHGSKPDFGAAIRLFEAAAGFGHTVAMYDFAFFHANGRGVPKNEALAVTWWENAARKGLPMAQYQMGIVSKAKNQPSVARDWYEKAAARGHFRAQYNLALALLEGAPREEDLQKALGLFESAAIYGYAPAALMAGLLLENAGNKAEADLRYRAVLAAPDNETDDRVAEAKRNAIKALSG